MGLPFLNSSKQKTPASAPNGQSGNGGLSKFAEKLSSSMGSNLGLGNTLGMPIAIDFGTGALKILQVNTGQPPAMQAIVCLETPQALIGDNKRRMEFQLSALPKLVKKGGFKGKRAVCSIPAWQTTCKHLQFPRQDGVPLAQLVAAAIPQQLGVVLSYSTQVCSILPERVGTLLHAACHVGQGLYRPACGPFHLINHLPQILG